MGSRRQGARRPAQEQAQHAQKAAQDRHGAAASRRLSKAQQTDRSPGDAAAAAGSAGAGVVRRRGGQRIQRRDLPSVVGTKLARPPQAVEGELLGPGRTESGNQAAREPGERFWKLPENFAPPEAPT